MTASLRTFNKSDFESGGQPLGSSVVLKTCTKSGGELVVKRVIASDSKVEMLKGLQHRNIICLLGTIDYNRKETGLVFEYAIHGNLYEFIDKTPNDLLSLSSLSFCEQATQAVAYIHGKNITHGNIKSASFLVFGDVIKLADFNLSEKNTNVISAVGMKKHTHDMRWMSPEVLKQNKDIDHFKSDVYSLAIVLWELYHMQIPYKGWKIDTLFNHVAEKKDHLEINTECCQEFTSMLLSCWKKDPSLRLTANEMLRSINKIIEIVSAETSDTVIPVKGKFRTWPRCRDQQLGDRRVDKLRPVSESYQMPTEDEKEKFRNFLKEFSDKYSSPSKYRWMRFLLSDILNIACLSRKNIPCLELFNELHARGNISYDNVSILEEIAEVTDQEEARRIVHTYKECCLNHAMIDNTLTQYRKGFFRALTEMDENQFPTVLAYYKLEDINNIWDLVFYLEKEDMLKCHSDKVTFAKQLNKKAENIFLDSLTLNED